MKIINKFFPSKSKNKNHGYIYILFSPLYGVNIFKISRSNDVKKRLSNHSCSHLQTPEYVYISELCYDYKIAETLIHQKLRQYRLTREFFNVKLEESIYIINNTVQNINKPLFDFRTV